MSSKRGSRDGSQQKAKALTHALCLIGTVDVLFVLRCLGLTYMHFSPGGFRLNIISLQRRRTLWQTTAVGTDNYMANFHRPSAF